MWLPTKVQINTATRYATAIAGTAFTIFGLQAKGISLDQIKAFIAAFGTLANDVLLVISTIGPIIVAVRGVMSSSPSGQAAAIGANGSTTVNRAPGGKATVTLNDPDMAAAALTAQSKAA